MSRRRLYAWLLLVVPFVAFVGLYALWDHNIGNRGLTLQDKALNAFEKHREEFVCLLLKFEAANVTTWQPEDFAGFPRGCRSKYAAGLSNGPQTEAQKALGPSNVLFVQLDLEGAPPDSVSYLIYDPQAAGIERNVRRLPTPPDNRLTLKRIQGPWYYAQAPVID